MFLSWLFPQCTQFAEFAEIIIGKLKPSESSLSLNKNAFIVLQRKIYFPLKINIDTLVNIYYLVLERSKKA